MIAALLLAATLGSVELYPRSSLEGVSRQELTLREARLREGRPSLLPPMLRLAGGLIGAPVGVGMVYAGAREGVTFAAPFLIGGGIAMAVVGAILLFRGFLEVREVAIARENVDWDLEEIRNRLAATPAGTLAFAF